MAATVSFICLSSATWTLTTLTLAAPRALRDAISRACIV